MSDEIERPQKMKWDCEEWAREYEGLRITAVEALDERDKAERHAEVLAEALDRFFRPDPMDMDLGERFDRLRYSTKPTLQALGYPKEET